MSDVKNKIKKEFEALKINFLVILDTSAENYSDAVMGAVTFMLEKGQKGIYVTSSRPYRFISNEMKRISINTDNILFLDCISCMAGEHGDGNCTYVENPASLEEISMHIGSLLGRIESDEKFLIMDSISTLLIYNSLNSVKEFSLFLINKLRLESVDGILVIIKKEAQSSTKRAG